MVDFFKGYKNEYILMNTINEFILNWWPLCTFIIFTIGIVVIKLSGEFDE